MATQHHTAEGDETTPRLWTLTDRSGEGLQDLAAITPPPFNYYAPVHLTVGHPRRNSLFSLSTDGTFPQKPLISLSVEE